MTRHETQIQFRGQTRDVDFEHEGDGVVLWGFTNGSSTDDGHDGATDAEEQAVFEELWQWLVDWWSGD